MNGERCQRWSRAAVLGAALLLGQGCGKTTSVKRERPTLAVFKLKLDQLRLPRGATGELQHHAHRMLETSDAYHVVSADKVKRALRRHRRRRRDRDCHTLRCQARLGRRLDAARSLALQVTKNLVGQCDVIGKVYDLERKEVDITGRARAGCAAEELRRSVDLVLCHIIAVQQSGRRSAPAADGPTRVAPPRECLARAEFLLVDDKLEALLAPPPRRRRRRRPDGWEQRMAERVLQLKREYDRVVQLGVPRWAVAATCRSGRLYEHYARQEMSAAGGPDPVRQQRAAPFVAKARELYQSCLDQARQQGLEDDRYTAEARTRLDKLPSPPKKK